MLKFLSLKTIWIFTIYVLLDVICTGVGMGVPFLCILLGLPVGWYLARRFTLQPIGAREMLRKILRWAGLTIGVTLVFIVLIWAPSTKMLFDPAAADQLANYGIPMILYDPVASFIGWEVLMMVISPILQFLVTTFAAQVTWMRVLPR